MKRLIALLFLTACADVEPEIVTVEIQTYVACAEEHNGALLEDSHYSQDGRRACCVFYGDPLIYCASGFYDVEPFGSPFTIETREVER